MVTMPGELDDRWRLLLVAATHMMAPSPEALASMKAGDTDAMLEYFAAVRLAAAHLVVRTMDKCWGTIRNWDHWWRTLATNPIEYSKQFDWYLKVISVGAKLLHRVPDSRPSRHVERDRRIYELRSSKPDLTFAEIAARMEPSMTANAVQRVWEREHERRKREVGMLEMVITTCLEVHPGRSKFPTPEAIFLILRDGIGGK